MDELGEVRVRQLLLAREGEPVSGHGAGPHAFTEQRGVGLVLGRRSLAPAAKPCRAAVVLPALVEHLSVYVERRADAFVFTGPTGAPIWRGNLNKLLRWLPTVVAMGVPGLHFHDLRHAGNTWAARTGASLRDLMARMDHNSADAAMIYQHATSPTGPSRKPSIRRSVAMIEATRAGVELVLLRGVNGTPTARAGLVVSVVTKAQAGRPSLTWAL
jgi:hypothetical protein